MRKIKEYPSIVSILIDYQTHETETTLRKREEAQGTDSHESCARDYTRGSVRSRPTKIVGS